MIYAPGRLISENNGGSKCVAHQYVNFLGSFVARGLYIGIPSLRYILFLHAGHLTLLSLDIPYLGLLCISLWFVRAYTLKPYVIDSFDKVIRKVK